MIKELEEIKEQYLGFAKVIGAPMKFINFYDKPQDLGYAHVEYDNGIFYYVVTEKGQELERKSAKDKNELLFWLIQRVSLDMALEYEKTHRDSCEDFRRKYFSKHIELLKLINPKWAEKERERFNSILVKNPFSDNKEPKFL
jgi:hypothetical protein